MIDQQLTGVLESLKALIPSVTIQMQYMSEHAFSRHFLSHDKHTDDRAGQSHTNEEASLWFQLADKTFIILKLSRPHFPLTKAELKFLGFFSHAIRPLLVSEDRHKLKVSSRIVSRYSFEHLLVTQYLRRWHSANTFWTPALILSELQQLSSERYEGNPATSGFLFSTQIEVLLKKIDRSRFRIDEFPQKVELTERFFGKPASYRYVNGRNAFYLVDNHRMISGVVRCIAPQSFSRLDRAVHNHLEPLIGLGVSRCWVGYVGDNADVNLVLPGGRHLRWQKLHWHFVDHGLLADVLGPYCSDKQAVDSLVKSLFTLSELRVGTVILLPSSDGDLPAIAGRIDDSALGAALASTFIGKPVTQLAGDGSILGLLSSDGLTTISSSGKVLGAGQIIDLSASGIKSISGGGRTQAALAASSKGLVLKVSEDGPISIFRNSSEILRLSL
jgi:hypothetical protein